MTESSKQRPPREFWVCSKKMEAGGFYYAEEKEMQPELYPHYIHVIEASYAKELEADIYDLKTDKELLQGIRTKLEAKLDVAVKALEFYANQNNWGMIHNEPTEDGGEEDIGARIDYDDVCRDEHDNNFMCAGEKARAVLAMIEQGEK